MICQCMRVNPTSTTFDLISGDAIVHEYVVYNKQVQMTFLHLQGEECNNGRDRQILLKLFNLKSSPLENHLFNF